MAKPKQLATTPIKKPNQPVKYTEAELADWFKCANDPLYFMENYMYIQHSTKGRIKFEPYDFQKELINSFSNYDRVIGLLPRQVGKCVVGDTVITVRKDGVIYKLPINKFEEHIEKGLDISEYIVNA